MFDVYVSELVLDDSYEDRREYLESIHSGILSKLQGLRIPLTTSLREASFMIIIFTRCSLPRLSEDLLRILNEGIPHCVLFCDWTHLPPTATSDFYSLFTGFIRNHEALGIPSDGMEDHCFNELLTSCDQENDEDRTQLRSALKKLIYRSTTSSWALPNGVYLPKDSAYPSTVIDDFVNVTVRRVNSLSIDFNKLTLARIDLYQISSLILRNLFNKRSTGTTFIVVSGTKQHDLTNITKFLAMQHMSVAKCDGVIYFDNCPMEFNSDFYELTMADLPPKQCYTFIIALDGVSTMSQIKEIHKLDEMFSTCPRTIIILSTQLDIFRKFNFHSPFFGFLGYVNGASVGFENPFQHDVGESRPFCIQLDGLGLGVFSKIDDCLQGSYESIDMRKLFMEEYQKAGAKLYGDITNAAESSTRANNK